MTAAAWRRREVLKGLLLAAAGCSSRERSAKEGAPAGTAATAANPASAPVKPAPVARRGLHLSPCNLPGQLPDQGSQVPGLEILDLDTRAARRVPTPATANGHSVVLIGDRRAILLPQFGDTATVVDLATATVIAIFQSTKDNLFYGHGALIRDGRALLTVESGEDLDAAEILVRDSSSFELLERVPAYGPSPHEIRVSADGKNAVIMNGNTPLRFARAEAEHAKKYPAASQQKPPSRRNTVNIVELASGKLLESFEFEPRTGSGHLTTTSDDLIIVGPGRKPDAPVDATTPFGLGTARLGSSTLELARGATAALSAEDAEFARRAAGFSFAVDEPRHRVCVTHPQERGLSLYDYASLRLEAVIRTEDEPLGAILTADGGAFIIATKGGTILELDAQSLEVTPLETEPGVSYFGHSTMV